MHIMAVGVGSDVNTTELTAIAMNDPKSVFNVSGYEDLAKILKDVLAESCKKGMFALMFYEQFFHERALDMTEDDLTGKVSMLNYDRFVYGTLITVPRETVLFSLDLRLGADLEILGKTKLSDEEIKLNVSGSKL